MTVLLVDDDADALALLQMLLARHGVECVLAESVAEARAVLTKDSTVDVVVADLELGDGDGLELHPEAAPRVKAFIVLTGRDAVSAPPGVRVLSKPLDFKQLLTAIKAAAG
ncbi:MAG: response regulator [Deltaproteobacteria bacterium]|nr:response regulator [Deltaproteobacteria bacterium]